MSRVLSHRRGRQRIAPRLLALCTALTLAACSDLNDPVTPHGGAPATGALAVVKGDRVATVEVSPSSASMAVGDTTTLSATARDTKGNVLTGRVVTWAVSDSTTATISSTGLVKALAGGTASVTATVGGKTGSATVTVGAVPSGTRILPGQSIQAAVDANPSGTAFVLAAGVHRMQSVTPKTGNTFTGEPGAVVSGATLVTAWTQSGAQWIATGLPVTDFAGAGGCEDGWTLCVRTQEMFLDDVPLRRVGSQAEVGAGRWYFNTSTGTAYIGDNPLGRRVELSVTGRAFGGSATGVTIASLAVEKYANAAQNGAIHAQQGSGWVVKDSRIRWNHGVGVRIGPSMQLLRSNISYNGQMGVGGIGNDVLIESDTIAYNNAAHFSSGWEAGGTKFVQTSRLTVRGNFVHHNRGPGLWTDFENINTLYENNRVEDNDDVGIFHEISYAATIRNNVVARNGFSGYDWLYGAGILISASPDVEIYGNTVSENARGIAGIMQNRGSGAFGPFDLHNMYVHDNTVTMTVQAVDGSGVGSVTGIAQDVGDLSYFTSKNNRFVHNTYHLGSAVNYFAWMNGQMTESQWQEFGQDLTGMFIR